MANRSADVIAADALNVTKFTGFGSAAGGVIAAVIAALAGAKGWPMPLQGALVGLAAVAVLVAGAVVIADMRTRAYLATRILPKTGDDPGTPVLIEIWRDLIKAAPSLDTIALKLAERGASARRPESRSNGKSTTATLSEDDLREVMAAAFIRFARQKPDEALAVLAGGMTKNGS